MHGVVHQIAEPPAQGSIDDKQAFVSLMLEVMAQRDIGLRALAARTGITKSRLGLLLHRDPSRRSGMTLLEFQKVLAGLDIDLLEAVVSVEVSRELGPTVPVRHQRLVTMLCAMFRRLPTSLISAVEEIEGADGTEIRAEWAPVLQRAVIKRLVHEVAAVVARRSSLGEFDIFS